MEIVLGTAFGGFPVSSYPALIQARRTAIDMLPTEYSSYEEREFWVRCFPDVVDAVKTIKKRYLNSTAYHSIDDCAIFEIPDDIYTGVIFDYDGMETGFYTLPDGSIHKVYAYGEEML